MTDLGRFRQVRIQATVAAGDNATEWQFTQGTASSTDYSQKWMPYSNNNTRYRIAGFNQLIAPNTSSPPTTGTATYVGNAGVPGGLPALTAGNYYTFNITKVAPSGNNTMAVLETAYAPVAITGISPTAPTTAYGNPVTVTATLGAAPSTGEYLYLRYTTNNYTTSTLLAMTVSGTTATATIPNLGSGAATASYYVLSSPNASGLTNANADMLTLNASAAGGPITYVQTTFVSVTQNPASGSVPYASPVTVTATYSATPGAGEYLYLRYSADGFATSTTVVPATQGGATATFTIPNLTSTTNPRPTVSYYLVTSTDPNAAGSGTPSALQTSNNGGSNYTYPYTRTTITSGSSTRNPGGTVYDNVPVDVSSPLSRVPDATQYFYVRYTTGNYTNSTIVAMSVSGSTATGTIAGLPTGTTVSYYIFSSPGSNLAGNYTGGNGAYLSTASDTNNGNNYSYTVAAPLPVSLTAFTAVRQEQNAALAWTTASETNNAGFEVQVSGDGREFRQLGFVASASANSLTARTYAFVDREAGKTGTRYYRLRQVDVDGTGSYSLVRPVAFGASAEFGASPNPFGERLTLRVWADGAGSPAVLTLRDGLGRVVLRQAVELVAGANEVELAGVAELPAGLYTAQLALGGQVRTLKLVKE